VSPRICYVPSVLPDELLYSYLARLLAYNALWDPKIYLEQLFGTKDIIPVIDLPTRLDTLHQRLSHLTPYDCADDLINATTLYPYHRPFLTIERHNKAQHILLFGGGKGLKVLMGRVANRFGADTPLRYCVRCLEEDIATHGAPFWHRNHQLPGITCCAKHHLDLVAYASRNVSTDKRRFILPPGHQTERYSPRGSRTDQVRFALLSRELLEAQLPPLDQLMCQATYRETIRALGFRSRKKDVDYDALADALRHHYADFIGFTHRDRLLATPATPLCWLRSLVGRPSRSAHPVCHLLLIGFLFATIDEFRRALSATESSIKCITSASRSSNFSDTNNFPARHDQLLRDTSIPCCKLAQSLGVSVTTAVSRRRAIGVPIAERRKYLDTRKLTAIRLTLATGTSPSAIAQQHDVSVATVYRLRAQSPDLGMSHVETLYVMERLERRRAWQQVVTSHHNAGIGAIRAAAPDTYAWLYRHDRTWLQRINAAVRIPCKRTHLVNWGARDELLCRCLAQQVDSVISNPHRPRISKTFMLRTLGDAMVRVNVTRLPRLQALLAEREESQLAFQMFRIDRAVQQLAAQGLQIQLWRIQRLAGIREFTETLRAYVRSKTRSTS